MQTSVRTRICNVYLVLFSILIAMPAMAQTQLPHYAVKVQFILEQNLLLGSADITLPPNDTAHEIYLGDLNVNRADIDGTAVSQIQLSGRTLPVAAAPSTRKIHIQYSKSYTSPAFGNAISQEGISLTDVWHPIPDSDAQFNLTATIPEHFEAISEADTVTIKQNSGQKEVSFTYPYPIQSLHFVAGDYQVLEAEFSTGKKVFAYFFNEDLGLAKDYIQKTLQYLQRYEAMIGPYPFQRYSIVENRLPTGYAMPTFTLIGQSVVRLPFIVETSLGHEVLHSWFGNSIRPDRQSGNWSEGLVTYLADHAFAADKGEGLDYRKNQLIKYKAYVHPENAIALMDFVSGTLERSSNAKANQAIGYGKASMFFHMLKKRMGDKQFQAALQDFYATYVGEIASWSDIEKVFTEHARAPLDVLFQQWTTRSDIPFPEAMNFTMTEENGEIHLRFMLHQDTDPPYFLEIPLLIKFRDRQIHRLLITNEHEKQVDLTLPDYPSLLVLDPEYDLMRKLHPSETPPVWSMFEGAEKRLVVVDGPDQFDRFESFINQLEGSGAQILAANEITDADLAGASLLFLDASSASARGLFGPPPDIEEGMLVDVRTNPLNPEQVAVLITVAEPAEIPNATRKLTHYGKYSYLHFSNGHAVKKEVAPSASGIGYLLDVAPKGAETSQFHGFYDFIPDISKNKVIYVGESHTEYEDHRLQLRVIRALYQRNPALAIGMEMFPRSSQDALDAYIAGKIDEAEFLRASKYFEVWRYDYRLYREILQFARANQIPVVGLNIDKTTVSKIYKDGGISALAPEEVVALPADRDLDVPGYRSRIHQVFSAHPSHTGQTNPFAGFLQAQALWDETMAESIANFLQKRPETQMVVLAGKAHTISLNAIPPRVSRRLQAPQTVLINAGPGEINRNEADFIFHLPQEKLPPPALLNVLLKNDKEKHVVVIDKVMPNGPADKANLKKDDVILAIDGVKISDIIDLKIYMYGKEKGETVNLQIKRHGFLFGDDLFEVPVHL